MSDTIRFEIPINNDGEGFFGRECPNEDCLGYFKIELGTGLQGEDLPCHCPYCGHTGPHDTFWTQDQLEYARSLAMREVQKYVGDMLKKSFPRSRPKRGELISLTFDYKPGRPLPIYRYEEKQLETTLVCSECSLRYAVYGVFGYCPDCREHNSLQILNANVELALKQLDLAESVDGELAVQLVQDALENGVSAFDAFGRELVAVNLDLAHDSAAVRLVSCQNIDRLRSRLIDLFGFDLAASFDEVEWHKLEVAFQKRHLLAHRAGVVDEAYLKVTADSTAVVGRKVAVEPTEVATVLPLIARLGQQLQASVRVLRDDAATAGR